MEAVGSQTILVKAAAKEEARIEKDLSIMMEGLAVISSLQHFRVQDRSNQQQLTLRDL